MLLLREAQSFDDGAPVLFAFHLLPGKGYCGLSKLCVWLPHPLPTRFKAHCYRRSL